MIAQDLLRLFALASVGHGFTLRTANVGENVIGEIRNALDHIDRDLIPAARRIDDRRDDPRDAVDVRNLYSICLTLRQHC
jgi:hypothetical protein